MKRIKKLGVLQIAKVAAIIYFLVTAVFMIPISLFSTLTDAGPFGSLPFGGGFMFIFMPFVYGIFSFVFTAVGCFVYNLVSSWIGGIEIEIGEDPNANIIRQTE
ncbi:hypothetical protein QWY93_07205 [Echinicola jeungdonensis]|uniref:DUF3566 domain-containing protein n=1 Tax=Echinicola jeungdonensis TaxID=709343 RepID=A0ABV5J7T9_9BACT|nr:hypothetical protein [Echinicola jeungdonensis]MDN3669111.1 hypothetical protein [Echinicola jeungdonensis]